MPGLDIERIRGIAGCAGMIARLVEEIPSTNEALMQAAFDHACAPPVLLVAAHQTAGRGRRGRRWVSAAQRSLTFSIAVERMVDDDAPPAAASIVCGVAVADALAPWLPGIGLKWPNDLWVDGGKLGGILVETRRGAPLQVHSARCVERLVAGIGINLLAPHDGQAAPGARGLFDARPGAAAIGEGIRLAARDDPDILIGYMVGEVVRALQRYFTNGLDPFIASWQRRDILAGEMVLVSGGDGEHVRLRGRALGIDPDGALRLQCAHGIERVRFGEVSVRRDRAS